MRRQLGAIALGGVLVVIGIASGWYAARQGTPGAAEESHEAAPSEPILTAQALKNLGVTVGEAKTSTFVRHHRVQAVVEDAPLNTVPVTAPLGGIVTEVHVRPGRVVKAKEPVVSVVRAPIPRPALTLTADLLNPVSETLHEAVSELRTEATTFKTVQAELERVRTFAGAAGSEEPLLPKKVLIDLEYSFARAKQELQNARDELERHGLTEAEIDAVQAGEHPPGNRHLWKRALEHHELWGETESRILKALPGQAQTLPWSVAAIGELSAAGLATDDLADGLEEEPRMAARFQQVATLLLQGNTVTKVRLLTRIGALEPVMILRAPDSAPDFDVAELHVRPGQKIEAGQAVAALHDARTMWLRIEPLGDELAPVAEATRKGTSVSARPLVAGAGPLLSDLRILRLATRPDHEAGGAMGHIVCRNVPIPSTQRGSRTWKLRIGLRYVVLVPARVLPDRFVLPAGAVTDDGVEKVVYVRNGNTFRAQSVHVEYEDDEVVVLANDGSIYPGDPVVHTGAFALGIALRTDSGGADLHHGHSH